MARVKPSIRPTETYTEPNFLRVYTAEQPEPRGERLATIEHLSYTPRAAASGRRLELHDDRRRRSDVEGRRDVHRAQLRVEHDIPVIYECHATERAALVAAPYGFILRAQLRGA